MNELNLGLTAAEKNEQLRMVALLSLGMIEGILNGVVSAAEASRRLFMPLVADIVEKNGSDELADLFIEFSQLEDLEELLPDKLQSVLIKSKNKIICFLEKLSHNENSEKRNQCYLKPYAEHDGNNFK